MPQQINSMQNYKAEENKIENSRKDFEAELRKEIDRQCEDIENIRKSPLPKLNQILSSQKYFFDMATPKKAERLYRAYLYELSHIAKHLLLSEVAVYERHISILKSIKDAVALILEYTRMVANLYYLPKTSKDDPKDDPSALFRTGANAAIMGTANSLSQAKFISHLLIQRYPELYKNCIVGEVEFAVPNNIADGSNESELPYLMGKETNKTAAQTRTIVVLKIGKETLYIDPSTYNGSVESLHNSQRPTALSDSVLPFDFSDTDIQAARTAVLTYFASELGMIGLVDRYLTVCKIATAIDGGAYDNMVLDDWCKIAGAVKLAEHLLIRPRDFSESARCCTVAITREDPLNKGLNISIDREFDAGKLIELFLFSSRIDYSLANGENGRANDEIHLTLRTQEKLQEIIFAPFHAFKAKCPQPYRAFYNNDANRTPVIGNSGNALKESLVIAEYHIEEALLGKALDNGNIKRNTELKKKFIEQEQKEKRKVFADEKKETDDWWERQEEKHEIDKKMMPKFHTAVGRRI